MKQIILSKKYRLKPNKTQEVFFKKACGTERWVWNHYLELWNQEYENKVEKDSKITKNYFTAKKDLTLLRNSKDTLWIGEVGATIGAETVIRLFKTIDKFFKKSSCKPKFKKKNFSDGFSPSSQYFRVDPERKMVYFQVLGWVKVSEVPVVADKYRNVRVKFDGKYWYVTYGVDSLFPDGDDYVSDCLPVGIDKGLKDLIVDSTGYFSGNFNKGSNNGVAKEVYRLERKVKRLQRKVARQEKGSNSRERTRAELRLVYRRLFCIRKNFYSQYVASLVRTKPGAVVVEDLNIRGMLKNRYLAPSIHKANWGLLDCLLENKCVEFGVPFVRVDRFYPSTQTCCYCGLVKTGVDKLGLGDRWFVCDCGLVIDRDLNASFNLLLYPTATGNSQGLVVEILRKMVESETNRISCLPLGL